MEFDPVCWANVAAAVAYTTGSRATQSLRKLFFNVRRLIEAIYVVTPTGQGPGLRVGGHRNRGALSGRAHGVQRTGSIPTIAERTAESAEDCDRELWREKACEEGSPLEARLQQKAAPPGDRAENIARVGVSASAAP